MNERFDKGLAVRKQVLGEAPVAQRVTSAQGELNADLQTYLTEFAWGISGRAASSACATAAWRRSPCLRPRIGLPS